MAANLGFTQWEKEKKSHFTRGRYKEKEILIIKPRTYMNLSGEAVLAFMTGYRIPPENLMVIVDDMALPFGKIRLRPKGGDGGHNGLVSIIEKIGSAFNRLRIGIDTPPENIEGAQYVLSDFLPDEQKALPDILRRIREGTLEFIESGIDEAMNKYN